MKRLMLLLVLFISFSSFAQNQYSILFLNKKTDADKLPKEALDKIMQGHMDNMKRLAKEGKLLAAGPFEGGGGIFILNTSDETEAKNWTATDPGIQANR